MLKFITPRCIDKANNSNNLCLRFMPTINAACAYYFQPAEHQNLCSLFFTVFTVSIL